MADGSGFPPPGSASARPGALPAPSVYAPESAFKDALSLWATGVAVATCRVDGVPHGLTISSFTSLSVKPPRVLFCMAKSARCSPAFRVAGEVAISLLAEGGDAVARRLAGGFPTEARFDPAAWDLQPGAPPLLRQSLARFQGRVRARLDAGSHDVLIVDVKSVSSAPARPLLYTARTYARLAVEAADQP